MEESKKELPAISLSDLFIVFRRCWIFLLIAALLVGGGTAFYLFYTHTDVYSANASLFVLRETGKQYTETSDVSIANNLIYDVADTVLSNDVLQAAIEATGSKRTAKNLAGMIEVEAIPEDTPSHIVKFKVKSTDPKEAQELAAALVNCVCDKMSELFNGEKYVKPYDSIVLPTSPSNPVRVVYIPLLGAVAAVFLYLAFLLVYLLDGRVDNEETLVRELNVILLGEVPNLADARRSSQKKGGRYYATYYAQKKEGETK